MTTTKSSSNPRKRGAFISAVRGQSAFIVIVFIILFITIVVPYLVSAPSHMNGVRVRYVQGQPVGDGSPADYYRSAFEYGIYLTEGQPYFIMVFLCITTFACALLSARYMHSMKMTDLYHSLPVRREKLLLTNLAASMLAVLGPFTVIYLGTMLGQLIFYGRFGWVGGWYFAFSLMDFLTISVAVFVVYAFTTLIAVNVGTTFDALAISGAMGFMPTLVYIIAGGMWEQFTYGAVFNMDWSLRLSPFLFFFERVRGANYSYPAEAYGYGKIAAIFCVWLLIGLVFLAGAIFFYRRRKSELAEQTQPHGILQAAVKCFAALCGSTVFVLIFSDRSLPVKIIVIMMASVAIGLVAELILSRGIRWIPKNIKLLALAGAAYSILFVGLNLDLFGSVSYIPSADSVAAVEVSYRGRFENERYPVYMLPSGAQRDSDRFLTLPESMEVARQTHSQIIRDYKDRDKSWLDGYDRSWYNGSYLTLTYKLKSGRTVTRRYHDVQDETYRILSSLEDNEDFIRRNHPIFFVERYEDSIGRQLQVTAALKSSTSADEKTLSLSGEARNALIEALRADLLAESIDDILYGRTPRAYLTVTLSDRGPDAANIQNATINEYYSYAYYSSDWHFTESTFTLHDGYTNTLALLESLGYGGLLSPDPGNISEILLTDITEYTSSNRVYPAMPNLSYNMDYRMTSEDYKYEDTAYMVFSVTDPAEIAAMIQKGKDKILLSPESCANTLFMRLLDKDGDPVCGQYISLSDIPAQMQYEIFAEISKPV